jgi:hypothetical protein
MAGDEGASCGGEDCCSDGKTAALVYASGNQYIELNRSNQRQKQ